MKAWRRPAAPFAGIVIATLALLVFSAVLLSRRTRRAVTIAQIEKSVRVGMTPEEVARALDVPTEGLSSNTEAFSDGSFSITLSESDFGEIFVPEDEIWLYLDSHKRVTAGIAKTVHLVDESSVRLKLAP